MVGFAPDGTLVSYSGQLVKPYVRTHDQSNFLDSAAAEKTASCCDAAIMPRVMFSTLQVNTLKCSVHTFSKLLRVRPRRNHQPRSRGPFFREKAALNGGS